VITSSWKRYLLQAFPHPVNPPGAASEGQGGEKERGERKARGKEREREILGFTSASFYRRGKGKEGKGEDWCPVGEKGRELSDCFY